MGGIYWKKEEDETIEKNYYSMEVKELQKLLPHRTQTAIELRAKRALGLTNDKRHQRKYAVNMQFFDQPNVLNSYWAGFIAADGCLSKKKHLVSFGLHWDDGYLLEQFVKDIGFEGEVVYKELANGQRKAYLYIWGVESWFGPLENWFSVVPRKSLILKAPNLRNVDNVKAYIRGYIDGDGGIYPKRGPNKWVLSIRGTLSVLEFIRSSFSTWDVGKVWHGNEGAGICKNDSTHRYGISGHRSVYMLSKLLEVETPHLVRKWKPITDYLKNK